MKVAVPSESPDGLAARRSGHFGHAPYFTIVEFDDDKNVVSVEDVKNVEHGEGGCGNVIQYAISLGIDGIVAFGMGLPPLTRFTESGVDVYVETSVETVGEVVKLFAEGKVDRMLPENACRH